MILEFAALSRFTGDPIYEEKARVALDVIYKHRHHGSGLVGTVINTNNGDWVRRESGVGAGIDSYYEYLLKVIFKSLIIRNVAKNKEYTVECVLTDSLVETVLIIKPL